MTSLRKRTPAWRSSPTRDSTSDTWSENRFQPPGRGSVPSGIAWPPLVPGAPPPAPVVSNFGRLIAPHGRLTRLSFFPTGAALTPDGRYLWTVSAGRYANIVEITRLADGTIVDKLVGPANRAYE